MLIAATLLFVIVLVRNISLKQLFLYGLDKISHEYNEKRLRRILSKYHRTVSVKMSFIEKIELMLIDKSNIRHYIPFMNFYVLVVLSLLIFALTFDGVYRVLYFIPSTVLICCLFALCPIFFLDILCRYNSEKVRRKLAEFISVLNRWCAVREDIFYAFEKAADSGLGEPLDTFIRDMTIQVRRGISPVEALEILQMKVDNQQFKDFIINIRQNAKHRGDIRKLLTNLENQFYKMDEEFNRRNISTYKDRFIIYGMMFAVFFIGYYLFRSNPQVERYYLATVQGKTLLTLFCLLYVIGFYLSTRITKFKY